LQGGRIEDLVGLRAPHFRSVSARAIGIRHGDQHRPRLAIDGSLRLSTARPAPADGKSGSSAA